MTRTLSPPRRLHAALDRDVLDSLVLASVLTALSYLLGLGFGWANEVNGLEAFAVFTSYSCTFLCVKQRRINYPIGALSTAAYCLLFWQQGLYASMVLNAYLTPALVYGWVRWQRDSSARPVTRVGLRWVPAYLGVTAVAFAGALLVIGAFGGDYAVTDSIILIGTLLAQFLMDNKKIENWFVWFAVDLVAVWEYTSSGLAIAGLQYVFFLGTAVWGAVLWQRTRAQPGVTA